MKSDLPGALVISLDFELHWGMRDQYPPTGPLAQNLLDSRSVVGELAQLFSERGIHATWATVGILFASTSRELQPFMPELRPHYDLAQLDAYSEHIGPDEETDPLHLAGSLVTLISQTPFQEVGSHTFSHYYCLEAGQTEDAFRADLASARSIAASAGIELSSLVLPRNQWNPAYSGAVRDSGFTCYRGPQPSWAHRSRPTGTGSHLTRAARLVDTYAGTGPPPTTGWDELDGTGGLCNVPASAFLRPYSRTLSALAPLQEARIRSGIRAAARRSRIFHLWWHPHNLASDKSENFDRLRRLLDEYGRLAASDGIVSMSMGEVAAARGTSSVS
jgi:Polysaccharide deacetylase